MDTIRRLQRDFKELLVWFNDEEPDAPWTVDYDEDFRESFGTLAQLRHRCEQIRNNREQEEANQETIDNFRNRYGSNPTWRELQEH